MLCTYVVKFPNSENYPEFTEFTKNNGHVSSIVYRIERSWTKGYATLIFVYKYKLGLEAISLTELAREQG